MVSAATLHCRMQLACRIGYHELVGIKPRIPKKNVCILFEYLSLASTLLGAVEDRKGGHGLSTLLEELEVEARRIGNATARDVRRVQHIAQGVMTHKFLVEFFEDTDLIVRFYPKNRSHVVNYEPDLLRRCSTAGLRVPEVLFDSREGPRSKLEYVVYRKIEGHTLSDRLEQLPESPRHDLSAEIRYELVKLSKITMSGFGELKDGRHACHESWQAFVDESVAEGFEALRRYTILEKSEVDDLEHVVPSVELVWDGSTGECTWSDISPSNILVDDMGRLTGLIDFEGTLVGDPLLLVGYCYAAFAEKPFFDLINEGRSEPLSDVDWIQVQFYAILRVLRLAKYAHKPLPVGYPRSSMNRLFPGVNRSIESLKQAYT